MWSFADLEWLCGELQNLEQLGLALPPGNFRTSHQDQHFEDFLVSFPLLSSHKKADLRSQNRALKTNVRQSCLGTLKKLKTLHITTRPMFEHAGFSPSVGLRSNTMAYAAMFTRPITKFARKFWKHGGPLSTIAISTPEFFRIGGPSQFPGGDWYTQDTLYWQKAKICVNGETSDIMVSSEKRDILAYQEATEILEHDIQGHTVN